MPHSRARRSSTPRKQKPTATPIAPAATSASLAAASRWTDDPRDLLRIGPRFHLADLDRASTPGWEGKESDALSYSAVASGLLASLQERLFAAATAGTLAHYPLRRVLIIAQGLDTAGKGGLARHVMSLMDPQGVHLTAFKVPTAEEQAHHFLWRVRRALPEEGHIGFFDRSHYEDILVPTVNGALSEAERLSRLADIRSFESELLASGTAVVKVCLMVSYAEQGKRLLERVDRADKHWKYSPADMDARSHWQDYQEVYDTLLRESSWPDAPWHVIPADHKWYARLAVTEILLRTLAASPLPWPEATFDVAAERARIRATLPPQVLQRYDSRLPRKLDKVAARTAAVDDAATHLA